MSTVETVKAGRRSRARRRIAILSILIALVVVIFFVSLMVGQRFYPLDDVLKVIGGRTVPGASFTVGDLRLPRVCLAMLAGFAFGLAGVTFQTLLRNPLASPDIIGISWGASAAAVVAIVVFGLSGTSVSIVALLGALIAAAAVYGLSHNEGFSATRLILIGIGVAAMLSSVVSYVLARAADWDVANALRWITGSLAEPSWGRVVPLAVLMAVVVPVMLLLSRDMGMLRLGDDTAAGMGVRVERTRLLVLFGAVLLLAFATAGAGPISFVAFMSGPIATRLFTRAGGSMLLPADSSAGCWSPAPISSRSSRCRIGTRSASSPVCWAHRS